MTILDDSQEDEEEERLKSGQRQQERLVAEVVQRDSKEREKQEEEADPPVFKSGPLLENAGSPQAEGPTIAPRRREGEDKTVASGCVGACPGYYSILHRIDNSI